MMGRLHVDLFMQDRFLINGVTVKIRLVRSKNAFSLMAGGANPDYKVRIVDAVLFVRNAVLSSTVAMAHIRALEKGTAKYPLRPVDCKVYSIAQGSMSSTHENLFLGTLPKRIIMWCVDNDALNGAFGKNPFHAKNNAINFLAVYVDGRQVPAKPLQPNFETGQYVRSYVNLFSATGKQAQDEGNELTRDDFGNGYTFFGFDLTPDACDGGCFHLVQKGNLHRDTLCGATRADRERGRLRRIRGGARDRQRSQHHLRPLTTTMQTDEISHLLSRDPLMCRTYDVVAKDSLPDIIVDTYPAA